MRHMICHQDAPEHLGYLGAPPGCMTPIPFMPLFRVNIGSGSTCAQRSVFTMVQVGPRQWGSPSVQLFLQRSRRTEESNELSPDLEKASAHVGISKLGTLCNAICVADRCLKGFGWCARTNSEGLRWTADGLPSGMMPHSPLCQQCSSGTLS